MMLRPDKMSMIKDELRRRVEEQKAKVLELERKKKEEEEAAERKR